MLVKNTYGVSYVLAPRVSDYKKLDQFGGSSLERKKLNKKRVDLIDEVLRKPILENGGSKQKQVVKLRSLSNRSKGKIRGKLISFVRLHEKLTFVTLTFCNTVQDNGAVKILRAFLKNVAKQTNDFQYLWVAEKQTKNKVFSDNIHFHLITTVGEWKIKKWWQYWLDVQAKYGIVPRDANYKPSSAFDVKRIRSSNIKGLVKYLTKYITKNKGKFGCQVWNCSKKISWLYTSFYSDLEFIKELERLEAAGQLGGKIQVFPKEFCNVNLIPLNRVTMNFYNRIDERNRVVWKGAQNGKEVTHVS